MKHNRNTYREYQREQERRRKQQDFIWGIVVVCVFVCAAVAVAMLDFAPELSR